MKKITLPTGETVLHTGDDASADETKRVFDARYAFAQAYAAERDWDIDDISIEQLLEIRAQQGWKTP